MNEFEKQVVGLAELLIADTDCGALHRGNWRFPCQRCIAKEKEVSALLLRAINDEAVRRHVRLGHDERDGNKPKRLNSSEND